MLTILRKIFTLPTLAIFEPHIIKKKAGVEELA